MPSVRVLGRDPKRYLFAAAADEDRDTPERRRI
jgi:hypothetical protein